MSTGVIRNFKPVGFAYLRLSGTFSGGVDHEGKARGHGVLTGEGEHAGWRLEGEWEDTRMRRGEMRMGGEHAGKRYAGEFGGGIDGRGELSLAGGWRFDGEWEGGCARRGVAEESDGAVYRVAFEGRCAWWSDMERAFDEKQSFLDDPWDRMGHALFDWKRSFHYSEFVTGASWDLLPVRASPSPRPYAARADARAPLAHRPLRPQRPL